MNIIPITNVAEIITVGFQCIGLVWLGASESYSLQLSSSSLFAVLVVVSVVRRRRRRRWDDCECCGSYGVVVVVWESFKLIIMVILFSNRYPPTHTNQRSVRPAVCINVYTDIYIFIYLKTLNSLYVYMYNNDLSPTATTNRQHRTMSIDNLSYYYNVNIYCYRVHVDESINVIVFLGNFVRAQTKFLVVS